MTKVYTKGGDSGETSLIGGKRVSKCDLRVEAYGTLDELTAFMALLADNMRGKGGDLDHYCESIDRLNSQLMTLEARLAATEEFLSRLPSLDEDAVEWMEREIDRMQSALPAITQFAIPGGSILNSLCHVCRTVCRRAERRIVELSQSVDVEPMVSRSINRLSVYVYILGRTL